MPSRALVVARETRQGRTLLHGLAAALSSARKPDEVLKVIIDAPAASLRADGGFVMLLDDARGELWPVAATGIAKSGIAPAVPVAVSAQIPSAEAIRRRCPILIGSLEKVATRYPSIAPAALRAGQRALAHTPLLTGRRVLGVLGFAFGTTREFSSLDEGDLRALGRYGGDALYRAELYESERDARAELASLSRRLVAVQEDERRRIARELHDEIGQVLTLGMLVTTDSQRPPAALLADAHDIIRGLLGRTRDLLNDLHPPALAAEGLLPTLVQLIDRYQLQTYITVQFTHRGLGRRYHADVEIAAFRIVQEALTNVARHAGVHAARVHAAGTATRLRLEVSDVGRGFTPAASRPRTSRGLSGMRERATMLGGDLIVHSSPGWGTRVTAELPARPSESVVP